MLLYLNVFVFAYGFQSNIHNLPITPLISGFSMIERTTLALIPSTVTLAILSILGTVSTQWPNTETSVSRTSRMLVLDVLGITSVALIVFKIASVSVGDHLAQSSQLSLVGMGWFGRAIFLSIFAGLIVNAALFVRMRHLTIRQKRMTFLLVLAAASIFLSYFGGAFLTDPSANRTELGTFLTTELSTLVPVLTAALVFATFYLAWQTRNVAQQTLKARLAEYEPIIKSTLGWIGPIGVSLKIWNVGRGVAKNIELEIRQLPEKKPARKWVQPLLAPNEFARLPFDQTYFKDLAGTFEQIRIKGQCVDVLGRTHPIEDVIDLNQIRESVEKTPQLLETTMEEHVGEIGRELEEIRRRIEEVSEQMKSGIVVKTAEEAEKERRETLRRLEELQKKRKEQETGK